MPRTATDSAIFFYGLERPRTTISSSVMSLALLKHLIEVIRQLAFISSQPTPERFRIGRHWQHQLTIDVCRTKSLDSTAGINYP